MARTVFLGLQGPKSRAVTEGQTVGRLKSGYTWLTPALLARISPEALAPALRDQIVLPEGVVHVSPQVLGEALERLTAATEILISEVGAEFHTVSAVPSSLAGLVETMKEAIDLKGKTYTRGATAHKGAPVRGWFVASMSQEAASSRGVTAGVDEIEDRDGQLGLYVRVNRFNGSLLDYLVAVVPLDTIVVDFQVVE